MKTKHRPCPFCSSIKLSYQDHISNGHGDCTFEAWIECDNCGAKNGFVNGWGIPINEDKYKAWKKWDNSIKF